MCRTIELHRGMQVAQKDVEKQEKSTKGKIGARQEGSLPRPCLTWLQVSSTTLLAWAQSLTPDLASQGKTPDSLSEKKLFPFEIWTWRLPT